MNLDKDAPTKPGTAVIWGKSAEVQDVISCTTGRIQVILMESFIVVNIYAPSGADTRREDLLSFKKMCSKHCICFLLLDLSWEAILTAY